MKVIIQNLAIEYKDEGEGPILLMLHGWGATLHYFDVLCEHLRDFRIIRMDMPGFGESQMPHDTWDVERYARFVAAFCEKLRIEPVCMLGHSFGGRVITKGVSKQILRPQKLVLVASAGVSSRDTFRNVAYAGIAKFGKLILSPLSRGWYERIRRGFYVFTGSDYLSVRDMASTFLRVVEEDLSTDAAKVTLPTLIIWGDRDGMTPLSEGKKLHSLIRGSRLVVIGGADHFVHMQEPGEVAQLIQEFI
jgi:pimeloyl-ACP methyl ester carboxylesterase